jgi:predicted Zn-dependent peptidase
MTLDRTVAPAFQPIREIQIMPLQTIHLQNNAPLHWLNAGDSPVLKLEVLFKVGQAHESKNGVNQLTIKMLSEGTTNRTSQQITQHFDYYGAFLETNAGNDRSSVILYCLTKHLESVLPAFCELLIEANFPISELEKVKQITSQNQRVQEEKNNYQAQVLFREHLFGLDNAYGRTPSSHDFLQITREEVVAHYEKFIEHKDFEVFLVGQISEKEIALINQHVGKIAIQSPETPKLQTQPHIYAGKELLVEKTESLQSSVRIGKMCIDRKHPDFFGFKILNEIFGGYFGSRLMSNIREDKGYTYGIYSSIINLHRASYLTMGADVKKEFTQQTLDEISKEIKILQTELVSADELERVRNYMLGSLAGSMNTAFDLSEVFKGIYFSGLGYEYYTNYVKTIQTITSEQLRYIAQTYLHMEEMLTVIVGGK